jgi:hypothetical protein
LTVWLVLDKINNAPNEKYGLFYWVLELIDWLVA